ncbi:single-stranded DNA-binding protein [Candidatus Methylacidiphilum infernorum]|uniref:Single-stranded DNA-binding protein n=1 Tax=Methylacidiphilum infernorum (isolate V4) TaxID=481448 RepID=B3E0Q5_METI4|nr:single-stranded DNA-binding protein [Candidatus Methylacidiphilum infernorum]ACD82809.1 Single-stranded DNA-binding protein [Methylacidiphilum infernorum V4]
MADLNKVFLIGNLTRDPECRYTPKGTPVGDISLAINSSFRSQDGQIKDEVCFVDVVIWGRQAETCKEYLQKGSLIFVEGRLQMEQWETKEGEKRTRMKVRADRIQFLGKAKGSAPSAAMETQPSKSPTSFSSHEEQQEGEEEVPF